MSELIVLMGIPGAGKSTWIKKYFRANGGGLSMRVVCPDSIREELTKDISNQTRNSEVFEIAHCRVTQAFDWGLYPAGCIFDATNVTKEARHNLVEIANKYGATKRLVVFPNYDVAWERNAARSERVVPMKAMVKMTRNFTKSLSQIGYEEWDRIDFVRD